MACLMVPNAAIDARQNDIGAFQPLPSSFSSYQFTQEELNYVLYGYIQTSCNGLLLKHAVSDVRLNNQDSDDLGKDRRYEYDVKSRLTLPENLSLVQTIIGGVSHTSVFCVQGMIRKGTVFGPYQGHYKHSPDVTSEQMRYDTWEMFENGALHAYIDGSSDTTNWMRFVNSARFAQEQNMVAIQRSGSVYYECCKDISGGAELLVWYGDCYAQFMGIPIAMKSDSTNGMETRDVLDSSEGFKCDRCGKLFAYQYYRDKHLKYTRCVDTGDRQFPCQLCKRSFEKRDRLRIHILHVHEKHRPHVCTVCAKSFSQSSSLNKHLRVHSGERPYKCTYCSKSFTASSILRTHLRQHSGERPFKCRHCGRTFASHAAHDSHERRTHGQAR